MSGLCCPQCGRSHWMLRTEVVGEVDVVLFEPHPGGQLGFGAIYPRDLGIQRAVVARCISCSAQHPDAAALAASVGRAPGGKIE